MGGGRRRYTAEFKAEAVRLVATGGKPLAQIARELGINEQTLHNWKTKATSCDGTGVDPDRFALEEENRRLRKENARLQEERDILRKATAFFANQRP
ncbi:MAG: transposase [Candidatus Zixiibacteriota bacterium]